MGREVRRVPKDWVHPMNESGSYYKPLLEGYTRRANLFMEMANTKGLQEAVDYFGGAPDKERHMPEWPAEECTHLMMYENTSEGTPISPAFLTPEELAQWLADTGASSFGSMTAPYEQWLRTCRSGWAPSAVVVGGELTSGVAALKP